MSNIKTEAIERTLGMAERLINRLEATPIGESGSAIYADDMRSRRHARLYIADDFKAARAELAALSKARD